MAGEPFYVKMPEVWGVRLDRRAARLGQRQGRHPGDAPPPRRRRRRRLGHRIPRPGPRNLSAMDRHVIANMGAELGATTTVFPSDDEVRALPAQPGARGDWQELLADEGAEYDDHEEIDLSQLEPLIAKPSSPGNVVPVREVAGQADLSGLHRFVGQSRATATSPCGRDRRAAAACTTGVSSRHQSRPRARSCENLMRDGHLAHAHRRPARACTRRAATAASAWARRRPPTRSACAPSPAISRAARARGKTRSTCAAPKRRRLGPDRRDHRPARRSDMRLPTRRASPSELDDQRPTCSMPPLPPEEARQGRAARRDRTSSRCPSSSRCPTRSSCRCCSKVGDDISTDEIMPAGARVLPFRSNIPAISRFCFEHGRRDLPRARPDVREQAATRRRLATTTARDPAASTPRWHPVTSGCASSWPRASPASTGRTWSTSASLPLRFVDPQAARINSNEEIV